MTIPCTYSLGLYYSFFNWVNSPNIDWKEDKKRLELEINHKFPEFEGFFLAFSENPFLKDLFNQVMENLIHHFPENAIFYADKLKTLTNEDEMAIYLEGKPNMI